MLDLPKHLRGAPKRLCYQSYQRYQRYQQGFLAIDRMLPDVNAMVRALVSTIKIVALHVGLLGLGMALLATTQAMALPQANSITNTTNSPTVPVNLAANPNSTPNLQTNQSQSLPTAVANADPEAQIATPPTTPFLHAQNNLPAALASTPAATTMPAAKSLANSMQPNATALSAANQKLLSHNAKLQREVNDLSTQVNVLINERSGQLFMYGAITVTISLILGFLLGAFIFSRRDRW